MRSETRISTKPLRFSSPVIFQSYKTDSFSLSVAQKSAKVEDKDLVMLHASSRTVSTSFEFHNTFPEPVLDPQRAVYDFCVNVSSIPEVNAITYQTEKNTILIWTFIRKRDKRVRRLIYEKEMVLMSNYPDMVFDFNVVSKADLSETFIPQDFYGYLCYFNNY